MKVIKIINGNVYETDKKCFTKKNVSFRDGLIDDIINTDNSHTETIIDASGLYVAPSFIDFHGHFFEKGTELGVNPDLACLPYCTTAAVDAGSSGIANFNLFSKCILNKSIVDMKCFVNASPTGLLTTKFHENLNPEYINAEELVSLISRNEKVILGLKLRMSKEVVLNHGIEPLKKAKEVARHVGCIVNIHMTNPVVDIKAILDCLDSGDIFTHVYHGKGETIIKDGKVIDEILSARERGIVFDASNGKNHFSFDVAMKAIKEGFLPDIVSTDITQNTLLKPPVYSLVHILSKYLNIGVTIEELIPLCTSNPAKLMKTYNDFGSIEIGKLANIAIFNIIDSITEFTDYSKKKISGSKIIEPVATIKEGNILYLNPKYTKRVR